MLDRKIIAVRDDGEYFEILETLRRDPPGTMPEGRAAAAAVRSWTRLQAIYYYSVRASFQLIPPKRGVDEQFCQARDTLRQGLMGDAFVLAGAHVRTGRPVHPTWFDNQVNRLRNHPQPLTAALARELQFEFDVTDGVMAEISARTTPPTVRVPSMLKAYYGQLNHLFLAAPDDPTNATELGATREFRDVVVECLLKLTWFTRETFHPVCLPVTHPRSQHAHELALAVADAQIAFLCLHEIAHVAFGHLRDRPGIVRNPRTGQRYMYVYRDPEGRETRVESRIVIDQPGFRAIDTLKQEDQDEIDADAWAEDRLFEMGWSHDVAALAVYLSIKFLAFAGTVARARITDDAAVIGEERQIDRHRPRRAEFSERVLEYRERSHGRLDWVDHVINTATDVLGTVIRADVSAWKGTRHWD